MILGSWSFYGVAFDLLSIAAAPVRAASAGEFEPKVSFTFLGDRGLAELLGVLTQVDVAIVLYASMSVDGDGLPTVPTEVADLLQRASRNPVYGLASPYLGHGIVGGVLVDYERYDAELAARAELILKGMDVAHLTSLTTANLTAFDDRALKRFVISEASLSAGVIGRYQEASLWHLIGTSSQSRYLPRASRFSFGI
jgi:hypothetical protein